MNASLKTVKGSFYKLDLVASLIRGMNVKEADAQLTFCSKRMAVIVKKLLQSAVANAKHNNGIENAEKLFIKTINVGRAFVLKRFLPCGRGRSARVEKRFSNIEIILEEKLEDSLTDKKNKNNNKK